MSDPSRLVDGAAPGSLRQALLRAGRDAAPAAGAKQALLESLARAGAVGTSAGTSGAGSAASAGKTVASFKAVALGKWIAVSIVGSVVGGGIVYSLAGDAASAGRQGPKQGAALSAVQATQHQAARPAEDSAAQANTERPASVGQEGPLESEPRASATSAASAPARGGEPFQGRRSANPRARWLGQRTVRIVPAPETTTVDPGEAQAEMPAAARVIPDAPEAGRAVDPKPGVERVLRPGLREELEVLDGVRRAIRARDQLSARRQLRSYWRRFPTGYLAPEARDLGASVEDDEQ